MLPAKILLGSLGAVGLGGGIIGLTQLLPTKHTPSTQTAQTVSTPAELVWSNYLVQLSSSVDSNHTTCTFNDDCKIFARNEAEGSASKASNLSKVEDLSEIKGDAHYVLSVVGKTLQTNNIIQLTPKTEGAQLIKLQVLSRMSIDATSLKIPKAPKKILPKAQWIKSNKLDLRSSSTIAALQNRYFINQTYPTHIQRQDIAHKDYLVFKWGEENLPDKNHPNKTFIFYMPKDADPDEDIKNIWKELLPETGRVLDEIDIPLFSHPSRLPIPKAEDLNIDDKLITIDPHLFKPLEEQRADLVDIDKLKVFVANLPEEDIQNPNIYQQPKREEFSDIFIEIFEIEDQENIGKSFSQDTENQDLSSKVDWSKIDKDSRMITKLSEMVQGKYYKFVFSDKKVVEQALKPKFFLVEAALADETENKKIHPFPLFVFTAITRDFFCARSQTQNKCGFLGGSQTSIYP